VEVYNSEEEQLEAVKRWWKANGSSAVIGSIMGIVLILGWQFWQKHQHGQAEQASSLYAQMQLAVDKEQHQSALKIAEQMHSKFGGTAYSTYTSLFEAKVNVQLGKLDVAQQILEKLVKSKNEGVNDVANIRLIRLLLTTGQYEQGLQRIASVDSAKSASFSANYDELTGDLYVALDRLGEARTAYQTAIREGASSPLLQFKLDDITASETLNTLN